MLTPPIGLETSGKFISEITRQKLINLNDSIKLVTKEVPELKISRTYVGVQTSVWYFPNSFGTP
jgi:hypothetical protein